MKNIFSALLLSLVSVVCFSQTPTKINYQAIARDASGIVLANESISANVKIIALSTTGTVVYHESHTISTNEFGLFYFKIGEGTPILGTSIADVNWETGPNFLSVNVNGDDLGITELVSVPYSMHSASTGGFNGVNITTNAPANGDILSYNSTSLQWELVAGGSSTDDQVIQNFSINPSDSTITLDLEDGGVAQTIDLRPYLSGGGSDDQNIESLGLVGTTLTVGIESGTSQTVDLSALQDGTGTDNQLINNFSIDNADSTITLDLQNGGTAQVIDLRPYLTSGGNIYDQDGTLSGNRTVTMGTNNLNFNTTGLFLVNPVNNAFHLNGATNRVGIGTPSGTEGKLAIGHTATGTDPSMLITQTGTALNRVWFKNSTIPNKYWEIAAQTSNTAGNGAWSVNHFEGGTYKSNFVIYSDGRAAFIDPAASFAPGFNVADVDFYGTTRFFQNVSIGDVATGYTLPLVDGTANYVMQTDGAGNVTWVDPTSFSSAADTASVIADGDKDTYVVTDLTGSDDDIIRFAQGGTEFFNMTNGRLNITNTGNSVFLGNNAGLNEGLNNQGNTFVGAFSGNNTTTGQFNVGIGQSALINNTTGGTNVSVGRFTMLNNTTGAGNTAIGEGALRASNGGTSTAIGYFAGDSLSAGFGNSFIGTLSDVDYNSTNTVSYASAIGSYAAVSQNQTVVIGSINGVGDGFFDANVGIGTTTPSNKFVVEGDAAKFDSVIIVNGAQAGYVLSSDASGNASWMDPSSFSSGADTSGFMYDGDRDTYIQTELNPDEDIIRFAQGGTEYFNMTNGRLNVTNTGNSTYFGQNAGLNDNLASNENTFIGGLAGTANTTGVANVAVGGYALNSNISGGYNTAFGLTSLRSNTTGQRNSAAGYNSMNFNTIGSRNAANGYRSLYFNIGGSDNSALGYESLWNNTTGVDNVGVGKDAGHANVSGSQNTFIGANADASAATLINAAAIGANAMVDIDNAMVLGNGVNVGIGTSAPSNKLEVVGDAAKFDSVIIVNGAQAGYVLTSDASGNASWKAAGGNKIEDLTGDTYIETDGDGTGTINEIDFNIGGTNYFKMDGPRIAYLNSAQSVYLGDLAGAGHTATAFNNVFVGNGAGQLNTTGTNNTGVGRGALHDATAGDNVAVGYESQYYTTTGSQNVSLGGGSLGTGNGGVAMTGGQNTAIGHGALYQNVNGGNNVSVGLNSMFGNTTGSSNTSLGYSSLGSNIGGNSITSLGFQSDVASGGLNNATAVGSHSFVSADNSLVLGSIAGINGAGASTRVGIGTTAPSEEFHIKAEDADILVESNNGNNDAPAVILRRTRGNITTSAPVSNSDALGSMLFQGWNGSSIQSAARIEATVDGTVSTSAMPGQLRFYTTPDLSNTLIERMSIESNGNVGIGTSNPSELLQLVADDADMDIESVSNFQSTSFHLKRARGSVGSPVLVQTGDFFANIQFQGYTDAVTGFVNGARIEGSVDGTPSTSSMPGKLVFYTTESGSINETERLRIDSEGNVGIGTNTPSSTLQVGGSFAAKVITHTAGITLTDTDQVSIWTNTSPFAAETVTLPLASSCQGRIYRITKVAPTSGTSTLTIATIGDFVDGQSSISMVTATSAGVEIISDGSNWYVLSRF